jgi:hypothetical protein
MLQAVRSDFDLVKVENNIVFIKDANLGNRSVTNDAENVVRFLLSEHPNHRIVYMDSDGEWGELRHNGREFMEFGYHDGPK